MRCHGACCCGRHRCRSLNQLGTHNKLSNEQLCGDCKPSHHGGSTARHAVLLNTALLRCDSHLISSTFVTAGNVIQSRRFLRCGSIAFNSKSLQRLVIVCTRGSQGGSASVRHGQTDPAEASCWPMKLTASFQKSQANSCYPRPRTPVQVSTPRFGCRGSN